MIPLDINIEKLYALNIQYLTILFGDQVQKKIIICTGGHWWTKIHVYFIEKGLPDMQNHDIGWVGPGQGVLVTKC